MQKLPDYRVIRVVGKGYGNQEYGAWLLENKTYLVAQRLRTIFFGLIPVWWELVHYEREDFSDALANCEAACERDANERNKIKQDEEDVVSEFVFNRS